MLRICQSISGVSLVLALACGCNQGEPGGKGAVPSSTTTTTTTPTTTPSGTTTSTTTPAGTTTNTTRDTTTTTAKPVIGEAEETFTLNVPTLSTSIVQGETKAVTIGINRGTNFDDDVMLKLGELPQGVTVTPANPTLKAGEEEVKLSVTAAADAALGDFTIKLTGTPAKGGKDATNELNLTVEKE
jgi:uncharacterized membrane protein